MGRTMSGVPSGIGQRVRILRVRQRWTAVELAKRSGVDRLMIAKIEKGGDMKLSHAIKLAEALQVSLDLLTDMSVSDEAVSAAKELATARQKLNKALTE